MRVAAYQAGSLREILYVRVRRPTLLSLEANRMPDASGYWSAALLVSSPEGWHILCRGRRPILQAERRSLSDQSPNAASWRAWLNRPTAGAGWLTVNDAALGASFALGATECGVSGRLQGVLLGVDLT